MRDKSIWAERRTEKLVKSLRKPVSKNGKPIEMTEGLQLVIEQAEKDWQAYKRGEMKRVQLLAIHAAVANGSD